MTVRTEEIMKTVPEQGSATFKCVFKDEDGSSVVPTSINWDLTALDGSVIAYNQSVSVPASTTYITISGSNFRILEGEDRWGERLLTIRATYNSTYGTGLPLNKQIKFRVQNLKLVGYPISIDVVDVIFTDDYVQEVA
jgi:hypothetical protein